MKPKELTEIIDVKQTVLFFDTCSIIDIIRYPMPGKDDNENLLTAIKNLQYMENDNKELVMFLPSVFSVEWKGNFPEVMKRTKTFIEDIQKNISRLDKLLNCFDQDHISKAVPYEEFEIDKKLFCICESIIDCCKVIEKSDTVYTKAMNRVINNIPPSIKGKDSANDCIIVEEIIDMCKKLNANNHEGNKIFISSNTKEFDSKELLREFESVSLTYVTNINWALYEAKKRKS